MKKHIIKDIKAFLSKQFGVDKCSLRDDITDDIGLCSLDKTELAMWVEKRYNLRISTDTSEGFNILKDVVFYVVCRVDECDCISHAQRRFCKKNCI